MRRSGAAFASVCACALLLAAISCGGHSPTEPTPGGGNGGSNQQPPPNNLPIIDAITIQGTRARQPASFADVGETVDVTVKAHDDETAADQLQYVWTATLGTFSGSGSQVRWQAPAEVSTPVDVTITLKVVEKYGQPGGPLVFEHDVTGTATLSLHDSVKEVGDMSRQFLLEFSDSSIDDVGHIMRNFIPGCYGTQEETDQVTANRRDYRIVNYNIGTPSVSVNFGGICPYAGKRGDACAAVPVFWDSVFKKDNTRGQPVAGTDWIAAFYVASEKKWGLCDSSFQGHLAASMSTFIR